MKAIKEMLKKLFSASYTDRKVAEIHEDTEKKLAETSQAVARYNSLLKKNGVTMQIVIAAGGDHGHK